MYEINLARRLSHACVHCVTGLANLLTVHGMSGLPVRAKYKHFNTICEHGCDSSPNDSSSSCLNWWSSKQGLETLYSCSVFLSASSQYVSAHVRACPKKWYGNCSYKTWGKMEFHRFTDGATIQGTRPPSLHQCQCLESWNPWKVSRKRNHTLQCGCSAHRTLIPSHSLRKAQYLRSSLKLVCRVHFEAERNRTNLG